MMLFDQPNKFRAFSVIEILGAVAVLAVLASIVLVSVRDSVRASQRAAAQRELQALNGTLQNIKSAGGAIPETNDPAVALTAMRGGVDLAGSEFTPIIADPPEQIKIGDEELFLGYSPEEGFSYAKADGEGLGQAGQTLSGVGATESAYPFDITDPDALTEAIGALGQMNKESPESGEYLAAIGDAAKLGYLSMENIAALSEIYALPAEDSFFSTPPLSTRLPADIFAIRIDGYNALLAQGTPEERAAAAQALRNDFTAMYWRSLSFPALGIFYAPRDSMRSADWSKVNLEGLTWLSNGTSGIILKDIQGLSLQQFGSTNIKVAGLKGVNMTGYNTSGTSWERVVLDQPIGFSGTQLNDLTSATYVQLYNTDVSGFNPTGKNLNGFRFNNVTGLDMAKLQQAQLNGAHFNAVDLTGFSAANKNMDHVSMVNATISASQLAAASSLRNMDLRGTGVTEVALREAGYSGDLTGTKFGPTPTNFGSVPWTDSTGNVLNFAW